MNFFQKLFYPKLKEKGYMGYNSVSHIGDFSGSPFVFDGIQQDNKLINEGYASNADVYAIIKKIAEVASDIPLIVERKTSDGWEVDETSRLNDLLKTPNEDLTGKEFRFNTSIYLLSTGDNFWLKTVASGFDLVTQLDLLEPNLVKLLLDVNCDVTSYEYCRKNATTINYGLEEVIHSMYLNPTRIGLKSNRGLSPLQAAYQTLTASNNRSTAEAAMLKNRGATGILSQKSEMASTPTEQKDLQLATDKILGSPETFGKVIATANNLTYTPIGMSATDLKMIEGGLVSLRQLCNIYGVDSTMFNDKAASTLDNVKVADKKLYTDSAIPLNNKFITTYDKNIIPAYEQAERRELRIVQDTSNIEALQKDQKAKAEKDAKNVETTLKVLQSPISRESKIETLVNIMGLDQEMAETIVGAEITGNENVD